MRTTHSTTRELLHWIRARHTRRNLLLVLLIVGVFALPTILPEPFHYGTPPATFAFTMSPDEVSVDQPFTVALTLHTRRATNAVGAVINFNPTNLEIVNMTTQDSFCSFYPENSFDTIKGEVRLFCGTPNPGFKGTSTMIKLTLRAKTTGSTSLTLDRDETRVFANDGKGTNLLNGPLPELNMNVITTF